MDRIDRVDRKAGVDSSDSSDPSDHKGAPTPGADRPGYAEFAPGKKCTAARIASQPPFAILAGFGNDHHNGQRSSIGRAADL